MKLTRRAPRQAPYVLVERTGHFRLIDGRWHREVVLRRRVDSVLVSRYVLDEEVAA